MWLKLTRLKPAEDGTGDQKFKEFVVGTDYEAETVDALVKWLGAASSQRCFMSFLKNHAMAAVGKKGGDLYFFDPNGGIVSTKKPEKMTACLTSYLGPPVSEEKYKTL